MIHRRNFCASALLAPVFACRSKSPVRLGPNDPVEVRGITLDGESLDLGADFAGRPVLLNAWASWCGPCKLEFPELVQLYRKYGKRRLAIVGINVDAAGQLRRARAVAQRFSLPFPSVQDPNSVVANHIGARALPTSLLLDPAHKVVWRHEGMLRADNPHLLKALARTLSAPLSSPQGSPAAVR